MHRTPSGPVRALVTVTAALAAATIAAHAPSPGWTLLAWIAACVAGEALWVRLPFGGATMSLGSTANLAALLSLPRGEAIVAASVATLLAELLVMRKPAVRALYNASHTALAVAGASWMFAAAGGAPGGLAPDGRAFPIVPIVAAALAYYLVNRGAVAAVVAAHERIGFARAWIINFGGVSEAATTFVGLGLGVLLALVHVVHGPSTAVLAGIAIGLAMLLVRRRVRRLADGMVASPAVAPAPPPRGR